MAKTLIIKDADFEANRLAQVSFDPAPVPMFASPQWEWRVSKISDLLALYDLATANPYKYMTAFGKESEASEHKVAYPQGEEVSSPYAIKLPIGTTAIKISANSTSAFYNGTGSRIVWTKDVASGAAGENYNKIKGIERVDYNASEMPQTLNVPDGADSFIITVRFTNDQSFASANACAENYGISIEFITD